MPTIASLPAQRQPHPPLTPEQARQELDQFCELIRNKKQGVPRGVKTAKIRWIPPLRREEVARQLAAVGMQGLGHADFQAANKVLGEFFGKSWPLGAELPEDSR